MYWFCLLSFAFCFFDSRKLRGGGVFEPRPLSLIARASKNMVPRDKIGAKIAHSFQFFSFSLSLHTFINKIQIHMSLPICLFFGSLFDISVPLFVWVVWVCFFSRLFLCFCLFSFLLLHSTGCYLSLY